MQSVTVHVLGDHAVCFRWLYLANVRYALWVTTCTFTDRCSLYFQIENQPEEYSLYLVSEKEGWLSGNKLLLIITLYIIIAYCKIGLNQLSEGKSKFQQSV